MSAVIFIGIGLIQGMKALCILDDSDQEEHFRQLQRFYSSAGEVRATGQLVYLNSDSTYLKNGEFLPESMVEILKSAVEDALSEGYPGVYLVGEFPFCCSHINPDQIFEYERGADNLLLKLKASFLCLYNRSVISEDDRESLTRIHPCLLQNNVSQENPFFTRNIPPLV